MQISSHKDITEVSPNHLQELETMRSNITWANQEYRKQLSTNLCRTHFSETFLYDVMRNIQVPQPITRNDDLGCCYKVQKLRSCNDGRIAKVIILPGDAVEKYYNSLKEAE